LSFIICANQLESSSFLTVLEFLTFLTFSTSSIKFILLFIILSHLQEYSSTF
jgi:hypothetical protein